MSKRTSTRWYIGSWVLWAISWVVVFMTGHTTTTGSGFVVQGSNPIGAIAILVIGITAIVMLVTWIGALIRLGQLHAWGWFAAVLVLHLVALGIVGMVAYAAAGPEEERAVGRPTVT